MPSKSENLYNTFMDVLHEIQARLGSRSDALEAFSCEGWDDMGCQNLERAHAQILRLFPSV